MLQNVLHTHLEVKDLNESFKLIKSISSDQSSLYTGFFGYYCANAGTDFNLKNRLCYKIPFHAAPIKIRLALVLGN